MPQSDPKNWFIQCWANKCLQKGLSLVFGLTILVIIHVVEWFQPFNPESSAFWAYWLLFVIALGSLVYSFWNAINKIAKKLAEMKSFHKAFFRLLCEESWRCGWMVIFFVIGLTTLTYLVAKYCFSAQWCFLSICGTNYYFDYLLFATFLISVCMVCALMNEIWTYRLRRVDSSEVAALISDTELRLTKLQGIQDWPQFGITGQEHVDKIKNLAEKLRVNRGSEKGSSVQVYGGKSPYTEYDVLTLDQALLDAYSEEELMVRSDSMLDILHEYADDEERQYPREKFNRHEDKIRRLKEDLDSVRQKGTLSDGEDRNKRHCQEARKLKAYLVELMEHIAVVERYWFTGQAIARSLVLCSSLALVVFFLMGMLPVLDQGIGNLYTQEKKVEFGVFGVLNYAFLAASGAFAGVLKTMMQEKELDLGEDAGKRAAYRAVIGGAMGLAAGALAYALAAAGLFDDEILNPLLLTEVSGEGNELETPDEKDFAITVYAGTVYSFAVGFSFERFYERVKGIGQ